MYFLHAAFWYSITIQMFKKLVKLIQRSQLYSFGLKVGVTIPFNYEITFLKIPFTSLLSDQGTLSSYKISKKYIYYFFS